ncbi:MAG: hypothetical protein ACJAVO_002347 [Parvibaculaceae bacterium]
MGSGVQKSHNDGKTAYLKVSVWLDADSGHIHLAIPDTGWFHSTVNNKPDSKRRHANLYKKLARVLKEAGLPYPETEEEDGH